jgi:hypothetical protein
MDQAGDPGASFTDQSGRFVKLPRERFDLLAQQRAEAEMV